MMTRRIRYEIEPMTLGNMRELGVRGPSSQQALLPSSWATTAAIFALHLEMPRRNNVFGSDGAVRRDS